MLELNADALSSQALPHFRRTEKCDGGIERLAATSSSEAVWERFVLQTSKAGHKDLIGYCSSLELSPAIIETSAYSTAAASHLAHHYAKAIGHHRETK